MNTCQVSVIDVGNSEKKSGYTGKVTDCSHQRDEVINTQPTRLTFKIGAHLNLSMGTPPGYIQQSEVGVVGTKVSVVKVALNGEFPVGVVCVLIFMVSSRWCCMCTDLSGEFPVGVVHILVIMVTSQLALYM